MMTTRSRPTTPIRRLSQGSLASSARRTSAAQGASGSGSGKKRRSGGNGAFEGIETPLSFLTQAMGDLAYETATLQANLEAVDEIQGALHTFDESFSMFLYGLKMNAFCVEWPEAPREDNFERAKQRRADFGAVAGPSDLARSAGLASPSPSMHVADQTYMTQDEDEEERTPVRPASVRSANQKSSQNASKRLPPQQSKQAPQRIQISAAERKRREAIAAPIIDTMPLEYRGSDPAQQQLAKKVILALIAAGAKGVRVNELARSPELPQAKVNKCLIALVAAKHVIKRSENGAVYQLDMSRHQL